MTHTQPVPVPARTSSSPALRTELAVSLLGPSAAMAHLWSQIRRLAPCIRTVLLTGEPECGQESVARLLLDLSPQNHRPFFLLTAAEAEHRLLRPSGLVSFPSEVLLFLPDADRLSPEAQDAVLRLLKMRRTRNFTVVAAAGEDLRALVSVGRFSAELAEALGSVRVTIPSLRQRVEDLPMLATHLLVARCLELGRPAPQPGDEFFRAAMEYAWHGNLRELAQVLDLLCKSVEGERWQAADLHRALASRQVNRVPEPAFARMVSLNTVMNEHICSVLGACRGNKLRAAEILGISRSTLYRMLDAVPGTAESALPLAS